MNPKLLALAVTAALSLPASVLAQSSSVSIYGTLNVSFDSVKADGSGSSATDLKSRNRVTSNSSNIGFRGVEPLGGSLKAIFQIESGVLMDTGASSSSAGTLASRNSNAGVEGNLGTIFFGNWDTPYKFTTSSGPVDAFYAVGLPTYVNVLSGNATATTPSVSNRNMFDRRQNNSLQYWTPKWGGFGARFAWSPDEQRTTASPTAVEQSPNLYSLAGIYSDGPLYLSLAWEKHEEFANTATTKTDDQGIKFGASYTFGGATVLSAIYEELKFEGNVGATGLRKIIPASYLSAAQVANAGTAKVDAWYLSLRHAFGPHTLRAMYGEDMGLKVDGGKVPSSRAKTWAIGYSYSFSRRTDIYAFYTVIDNEANSNNDFANGGVGGVAGGADPKGISFNIRHTF